MSTLKITEKRNNNVIPLMTHPLGKYWEQPSLDKILIDDEYAVMTIETLKEIHDYSHSIPSGIYEGKIWRGSDDKKEWYLNWWGFGSSPEKVTHNVRKILILC